MKAKSIFCCALLVGALSFPGLLKAEWEQNTPYYEDDGLLDITEWFDGNDYNPTDEAWWRWDDEKYDAVKDTRGDVDSDMWYGYYGSPTGFYDYYDPYWSYYGYPSASLYPYGSRFYDYDNDGSYDAYVSWSDLNDDGTYDNYAYYSFNDAGTKKQQEHARAEAPKHSKAQTVTGAIVAIKQVKTRDVPHAVVSIKQQDQTVFADLGKAQAVNGLNLKEGEQITVKGPMTKAGKFNIILARSFQFDGKTHEVNRQRRQITATVLDTHKAKIRGRENLFAMVQQGQDKKTKMAVDLGPTDKLKLDITKGTELTFSGVPVKVKDKRLVIAQTVTKGDKVVQIDRQPENPADRAQPAGSKQKSGE